MFSLSSNANDAWFVHWTHFHPPSCYSISLLKWIIWGFCLLLKRKVIALIRKIRGNQNLWAIIQFMQHLTHYFMVFHHISVAKQCQHLFSTQKLKAVLAPNKIKQAFHTEDHEGPPLHELTHWPPNEYGTARPGWKAPICALNSFNLRCEWCAGARTVQYGGEGHMEWGPPTAQRTPAWERTCIRHCQPP